MTSYLKNAVNRPCTRCKLTQPLESFAKTPSSGAPYGRASVCKPCRNAEYRKRRDAKGFKSRTPETTRNEHGAVTHKACTQCKKLVLVEKFDRHKSGFLQLRSYCKTCVHDQYLKRTYGFTAADKEKLAESQQFLCAICEKKHKVESLYVDHCHGSGQIRGLLCNSCNCALGFLGDGGSGTIQAAKNLIRYIDK